MKSATIVLVAVTVFTTLVPESSSTPVAVSLGWQLLDNIVGKVVDGVDTAVGKVGDIVKDTLDIGSLKQATDKALEAIKQSFSCQVDEELKEKVYYRINRAEIILVDLIANVTKAAAKTDCIQNVVLTKTLVQLEQLQGIAIVFLPSLKLAVSSGNNLALKINADILVTVIAVGIKEFGEMVTSLESTPGEVAAAVKTQVQRGGSDIVALGKANLEDINKVLADRGYLPA